MAVPARRYHPSRQAYRAHPAEWEYPVGSLVKRLNTQGCLDNAQHRYFVWEALAGQRVCLESLEGKLLVRYQHMGVREIDILAGKTTAVVLPAPHPHL